MDPLKLLKETADTELNGLEVTPGLKARTLARIREESGRTYPVHVRFAPLYGFAILLVSAAVWLYGGGETADDLSSTNQTVSIEEDPQAGPDTVMPFIDSGVEDPHEAPQPGDQPLPMVGPAEPPLSQPGADDWSAARKLLGEDFQLPPYTPEPFRLTKIYTAESKGRVVFVYRTPEHQADSAVYRITVFRPEQGVEDRLPAVTGRNPVSAEWVTDGRRYLLIGQLDVSEAKAVGNSLHTHEERRNET